MEVNKIFSENTPEQIQYAVRNGLAPELWSVGDTIQVPLKGNVGILKLNTYCAATIIGFNHNSTIEGTNTMHLCFEPLIDEHYLKVAIPNSFSHHNITTNRGGWNYSNIRRNILPQIKECLPKSWQNIITPCIKYTDNIGFEVGLPECVSATSDDIWLLSEYEVFGKIKYSNATEAQYQQRYEYFKAGKIRFNSISTAVHWWLRSPYASYTSYFCYASIGGLANGGNASYSLGLTPCIQIS